jgi:hypothetical protein
VGIAAHQPAFEPYVKVVLSYGSSLFQACFRTRLRDVYLLVMHLSVTIGVEKEQVGEIVRATVDPIENMMNVPSTLFGDLLVADRAFSLLLIP